MKQRFFRALQDIPFALLLVIAPRWIGVVMVAVYVINKTVELPHVTWVNGRRRKNIN